MIKVMHICDLCGASEEKASDMDLLVLDLQIVLNGSQIYKWHACQTCRAHIVRVAVEVAQGRKSK